MSAWEFVRVFVAGYWPMLGMIVVCSAMLAAVLVMTTRVPGTWEDVWKVYKESGGRAGDVGGLWKWLEENYEAPGRMTKKTRGK